MIAVLIEAGPGQLQPAALEPIAIAQQLDGAVTAVVAGARVDEALAEVASFDLQGIVAIEHERLQPGATEPLVSVLATWIDDARPELVVAAHSYAARDYLPRLAARLDRPLVTGCVGVRVEGGQRLFRRPIFQGKFVADVALDGPAPHFATFQAGSASVEALRRAAAPVAITRVTASVGHAPTWSVEPPFRDAAHAVDLTRADRIVAVGRGIKDAASLELIRTLAAALGAEIAASRPVCDAGWLPLDRQVGSSGQTVAPSLYVAIGISGAIQHIVGMKGARTIVAINKDPHAPIFEIADVGIVGDLFEVVPALIAALDAA